MKKTSPPGTPPTAAGRAAVGGEVYAQLRDLIVRGRLAPGRPLGEQELARELRVSRTPVREALRHLHRDGLATFIGGGERTRLAVTALSRVAVLELYRAAGALEGVAARELAHVDRASRIE